MVREHELGNKVIEKHGIGFIEREMFGKLPSCVVCRIDKNFDSLKAKKDRLKKVYGHNSKCQKGLSQCTCCKLIAHTSKVQSTRKIFEIGGFEGKTCFEIAHDPRCEGLWQKTRDRDDNTIWRVKQNHKIYRQLMDMNNVKHKERKNAKKKNSTNDSL